MNNVSKTNKYFDSEGNSYTQGQLNKRITEAKEQKLQQFYDEHGYHYCEDCFKNAGNCFKLDCSHDIGVKECKENKQVELAWDINNITLRCRICHQKHDKLC